MPPRGWRRRPGVALIGDGWASIGAVGDGELRKGSLSVKIQINAEWMVAGAGETTAVEEEVVSAGWSEERITCGLGDFRKRRLRNVAVAGRRERGQSISTYRECLRECLGIGSSQSSNKVVTASGCGCACFGWSTDRNGMKSRQKLPGAGRVEKPADSAAARFGRADDA